MENISIPSSKSLTLTNKIPDGNINNDNITVGNDGLYNIAVIPHVNLGDTETVNFSGSYKW